MKKLYLIFVVAALLCLGTVQQQHIAVIVNKTACPPYHANTNVTFSWDGDHRSGAKYGCKTDGSTILGTGSLTPGTSYGENGSYGLSMDGTNALVFATSGDAQIDNEIGTVWVRIKLSAAALDDNVYFFEGNETGDTSDSLGMFAVLEDDSEDPRIVRGRWGTTYAASANDVGTGSFITVGYSWYAAGDDHSAFNGSSWEDDDDEITPDLADFDQIVIGQEAAWTGVEGGAPGAGNYLYVDRIAIMSCYKSTCPDPPDNW
jgi:hypothetical protein